MTDSHVNRSLRERAELARTERVERVKAALLIEAERAYAEALGFTGPQGRMAQMYAHAIEEAVAGNFAKLRHLAFMRRIPVTIDEFLDSREFLGELQDIWPALRPDIKQMNPDVFLGEEPVHEALLGGATGTGKTTLCYSTNAYQIYLFECFNTPQRLYNLTPVTPIVFMMQSVSQSITKRIIYRPFRDLFTAMPFCQRWLTWDKRREAEFILEQGITVVPALANLEAILGQAIAGSMQDEVNFMQIIENSKRVVGGRGQGGKFDQAKEVHSNITRRRARSFTTRGYSMGTLCILSSTRYKNDFLDQRIDEVRTHNLPNIVTLRRKQYEVVPQERFKGPKFKLVVGTDEYRTQIVEEGHVAGVDYPEHATIETIPVEYKHRFQTDPDGALRDIVGVAVDAIAPFIGQRHKVVDAVTRYTDLGLKPICARDRVELATDGMPQWDETVLEAMSPSVKAQPRFAHIDLSITGDACGVSIVRLAGFENRVNEEGHVESLPIFIVECAVSIKPSPTRELDIAEVRRWVLQLHTFYGLHLYAVTYDGFQSVESRQALQKTGVRTWGVSMDRTDDPYMQFRRTFYEDRIAMPLYEQLKVELSQLEYNSELRKVDHPPKGSKDVADAVCGAIYAAQTSRLVRNQAGTRSTDDGEPVRRKATREAGPRPK